MYRVAKKHKARRVVGEFLNELVDAVVYDAFFFLADLFRGFIDEDYGGRKSAVSWAVVRGKGEAGRDNRGEGGAGDIHTDDGGGLAGAGGPEAELAEVVLGFLREGVEP